MVNGSWDRWATDQRRFRGRSGLDSGGDSAVCALTDPGLRRGRGIPRLSVSRASVRFAVAAGLLGVALAACAVGPNYTPEPAPVPAKYKELKGWKVATPSDGLDRGDWWKPYRDPKLDFLLRQVEISNQTVAAQAAAYEQARAVIREAQSSLFPQLTGNYSFNRTRTGPNANGYRARAIAVLRGRSLLNHLHSAGLRRAGTPTFGASIRRQIESDASAAQASSADLDNAKLSAQAQLATAYFNLRAADALHDLLSRTVAEYKRTLAITENQYNSGIVIGRRRRHRANPGSQHRGVAHQCRRAACGVRARHRGVDRQATGGTDDRAACVVGRHPENSDHRAVSAARTAP